MKISTQTQPMVMRFGAKQAYRMIREAGFDAIDWGLDLSWRSNEVLRAKEYKNLCVFEKDEEEILAYYAEELPAIRENGLLITQAHAPNPPFKHGGYEMLEYAIAMYRKIIAFCQTVGCPRLVIHAVSVSALTRITDEECDRLNHHLYESLIPDLLQTNVTVCIENLWEPFENRNNSDIYKGIFSDPLQANALIDDLNAKAGKKCFGICLDTGHLHLTRLRFSEYIPVIGKRLQALHIHDNNQSFDSHLMPYMGSARWEDFTASLRKAGYSGDLNFETCGQMGAYRLPDELVPLFLRATARIGEYFKTQIQSK